LFRSKIDATVIPQAEHQRLAGSIASLWGNAQFELPSLPRKSYIDGVLFHDRGYGYFDTIPLGEAEQSSWENAMRQGLYESYNDPVTDAVVCLHIKRLLTRNPTRKDDNLLLIEEAEKLIHRLVKEHSLDLTELLWADKITDFCDRIAFDFSFRAPVQRTFNLYNSHQSHDLLPLDYSIDVAGNIQIAPWPLSVETYSSLIFAYQEEDYNRSLIPQSLPFTLKKAAPSIQQTSDR
jgi:hypothetical protein